MCRCVLAGTLCAIVGQVEDMKIGLIFTILFLVGRTWMAGQTSSPGNPACEKLFPVALVEKISGQKDVRLISRSLDDPPSTCEPHLRTNEPHLGRYLVLRT